MLFWSVTLLLSFLTDNRQYQPSSMTHLTTPMHLPLLTSLHPHLYLHPSLPVKSSPPVSFKSQQYIPFTPSHFSPSPWATRTHFEATFCSMQKALFPISFCNNIDRKFCFFLVLISTKKRGWWCDLRVSDYWQLMRCGWVLCLMGCLWFVFHWICVGWIRRNKIWNEHEMLSWCFAGN